MIRKILPFLFAIVLLLGFFSFRLTEVPAGTTGDEAAFGYNAVLLSRTLHDENGRKLPVFVLSLGSKDWRQPVTQYLDAIYFKVFGPSLFNLRFTSVILAAASVILIFILGRLLDGKWTGIFAGVALATAPIFMIQSHLALDNIAPVPFVLGWLLFLFLYDKSKKNIYLIASAVSLGIGFYSYKGMRIFVPVDVALMVIYLSRKNFRNVIKSSWIFLLSILPFFAIIPYLEKFYAGAVLDNQQFIFPGIYNFLYPYISTFDPSFLFIKGDEILVHSTGIHGAFLLGSLPFFIFGLAVAWKKGAFWKLLIAAFFAGPILFGFVGSVHRASRILAEVPLYALISSLGFVFLMQKKKLIFGALLILFALNYFDFLRYYFLVYPSATQNLFDCYSCTEPAYKFLKDYSQGQTLAPYEDKVLLAREGDFQYFIKSIYFDKNVAGWDGNSLNLPQNGVVMTDNSDAKSLKKVSSSGNYYFYVRPLGTK